MADLDIWAQVQAIMETVLVVGGLFVSVYFIWKSRKNEAKDNAIKAYKDVIDAYTLKMKEFEADLNTMKDENRELHAQVNQLIGENKALKNVIVKPDVEFKNTVTSILTEMRTLRTDFIQHSTSDDTRFGNIVELATSNNQILKKMLPAAA